ncbi:MAG: hypothetical protein K2W96_07760 [Gemmataceae bacterium]|nr:hypothetical protein [Gemmataceae bacterium]
MRAIAILLVLVTGGASQGAAPPPVEALVRFQIKSLGDDSFDVRERASARLAELGRRAAPALQAVFPNADPEIRSRVRRLLDKLSADAEREARLLVRLGVSLTLADWEDASSPIIEVTFPRLPVEEHHLQLLVLLPRLQALRCNLSDKVTDDSFSCIAAAPFLELLAINSGVITDRGLRHLARIRTLTNLNVTSPAITGTCFKAFKNDALRRLRCHSFAFTDEGMEAIGRLDRLENLDLTGSDDITDKGIKHLVKLRRLQVLMIQSDSLTDACLPHFASHQTLHLFDLKSSKITKKAHAAIELTLPQLAAPTHSEPRIPTPPKD